MFVYFVAVGRDVDYKILLWPDLRSNFAIVTKGTTKRQRCLKLSALRAQDFHIPLAIKRQYKLGG